jgi:hypothetical protein
VRERLADRPPRPLADAPTGPLSDAADELARDWLVELLARLPLPEVGSLELEPLAAGAPDVCRAVVAALADDDALAELRRGGGLERQLTSVCKAASSGRIAALPAAVESLRRVMWSAALGALGARPPADLVAALSDRLAHVCATVCATVTATALGATALADAPSATFPADAPSATAPADAPSATAPADAPSAIAAMPDFVVHDARRAAEPKPSGWNAELFAALAGDEVRSLLLVDVDGHERLLAADGRAALQLAEKALVRNLVDDATMVPERIGRYWVVSGCGADETATEFARRLADAVAGGAGHLGVPLTASIGFTLLDAPFRALGKLGPDAEPLAAELCDRAEEAMLSARAAGAGIDSR